MTQESLDCFNTFNARCFNVRGFVKYRQYVLAPFTFCHKFQNFLLHPNKPYFSSFSYISKSLNLFFQDIPHCIQPFSSFTVRLRLTREQFRIQLITEFGEDASSTIESNQLHCAPAGIGLNNQLCIVRSSDWSNQREPRARQTTPIRHAGCRDNCVKKPKFYNFDETLPILRSYLSALSLNVSVSRI